MRFALATARDTHQCGYDEDALIVAALKARGAEACTIIWDETDPASLSGEVVIIRTTWDYQAKFDQFTDWLNALAASGVSLINSLELLLGTIDKAYLLDFATRGFAVPETAMILNNDDLSEALKSPAFECAIMKPCVGAGAIGLARIDAADEASWRKLDVQSPQLLQRFLPEIETDGEMSFVFFDGRFSHAVRKRPKAGDIRVQSEWGGTVEVVEPSTDFIAQAAHFLTGLPSVPTYARVDVVDVAGQLLLMELEVIEPELFCLYVEGAAEKFAEVLLTST